jgi:hypothetical protein
MELATTSVAERIARADIELAAAFAQSDAAAAMR